MGMAASDDEFERAARATARVITEREDARSVATATLRGLEQRLQEAIAGDTLRGLRSLAPDPAVTYCAARVRGNDRFGIDTSLPRDGREALVWTKDGGLAMAAFLGDRVGERPAEDADLQAQDLEPATVAARKALGRHAERAQAGAASYARVIELAARLTRALGG